MEKELLKQTLINSITDYVVGAIDNDFVEEEMVDVKEGVYIAPAADEEKPWYEQGCEVTWKDADGNVICKNEYGLLVDSLVWTLDAYANDFGDLVANGRNYVETIAEEIYSKIFEE